MICFTHRDIHSGKIALHDILQQVYQRARVWTAAVVLGGKEHVLRACVTSFHTNQTDVNGLIEELEQAKGERRQRG